MLSPAAAAAKWSSSRSTPRSKDVDEAARDDDDDTGCNQLPKSMGTLLLVIIARQWQDLHLDLQLDKTPLMSFIE